MQYTELDQNLNLAGTTWAPVFSGEPTGIWKNGWVGAGKTLDLCGAESISESKGNGFDKIGVFLSMSFVHPKEEWFL